MVGATLPPMTMPDPKVATSKRRPDTSPAQRDDSPRHRSGSRRELRARDLRDELTQSLVDRNRARRTDARNNIAQRAVDRSRAERKSRESSDSGDEGESCGAVCFTRRIRESQMPRGFKLTSEMPKYDGLLEPRTWLEDYLMAVRCQGGTRNTAMQYLQLQLTGSARAWLKSLPSSTIGSWEDLVYDFVQNFQATYKRPATIEELRSCT